MKFPISNFQFPNKNTKTHAQKARQAKTKDNPPVLKSYERAGLSDTFYRAVCIVALFLMAVVFMPTNNSVSYAMTDAELNNQLSESQKKIDENNKKLGTQRTQTKTLSDQVAVFDNQINNIQSQINSTQSQIDLINSQIENANKKISEAEVNIKIKKESLNEYLRVVYEDSNISTIELIAASDSFSDFVDKTEYNLTMQEKIKIVVTEIKGLKKELENKKTELTKNSQEIKDLQSQQVAQRQGIDAQRTAKNNLFYSSKGQESVFQKQIATENKKMADAWASYETAKNTTPISSGPTYGGGGSGGYLSWPLSAGVYQGYGMTDFASDPCGIIYYDSAGNKICKYPYGGKIHNGIDISSGWASPIKSAAEGTVVDTGYGYNGGWGNWVAIRHPNNLVTFYGHLSSIAVSPGQQVARGQQIGNEGNTGFSSGGAIHLHFSVYTSFVVYNSGDYHGPDYDGTTNPYNFL